MGLRLTTQFNAAPRVGRANASMICRSEGEQNVGRCGTIRRLRKEAEVVEIEDEEKDEEIEDIGSSNPFVHRH